MSDDLKAIRETYLKAKYAAKEDYRAVELSSALRDFVELSLKFLKAECLQVPLTSLVPGKQYFSYARKDAPEVISRPVNVNLFNPSPQQMVKCWNGCVAGTLTEAEQSSVSYTAGIAPCLAMELFDRQNKKGPATYYELLIGHILARAFDSDPQRKAVFTVEKQKIRMTMDFIFHLDTGGVRVHVPVKMSTRERVVQAWAHQRMLESAHGVGRYKGCMVLFAETKLDLRKREVVEICVPSQWLAYQALLSRMHRIYYLDVPATYQCLTDAHPEVIQIRPFGKFFMERDEVASW